MNMKKRETFIRAARVGLVVIMLCSLFAAFPATPVKAESHRIVVGGSDGIYSTIRAAVKNAYPNTVIYVHAGNYYEEINLAEMGMIEGGQGNLAIVSIDGPGAAKLHGNYGKPAIHDNNQPFYGALWIDGMSLDSSDNSVISLTNFNGLMLTNVTIANAGDPGIGATLTDAISLRAASGSRTIALKNTNVYNFVQDGLDVQVSGSAKVNVVIEEGSFKSLSGEYKSQKAVDIKATGTSTAQLTVYKTVFNSLFDSAISILAESATPVTLNTHVFSGTMNNVAKTAGKNAVEVRAKGLGAHTVNSWFYQNIIYLSSFSDGIELEPAAPGTFNSILRVNTIETIAGAPSMDRGIVIDNGPSPAKAATKANFKLEANTVKEAKGSGLDLHMRTTAAATWNGLISNNTFTNVNRDTPTDQEGVHFKVQNDGGLPTYTMVFTGNKLLQTTGLSNGVKLENINAGIFRVVSTGSSSAQEISSKNENMQPYTIGNVPTIRSFPGTNVENTRPLTNPDVLVTWSSQARPANVVENDTDNNAKMLVYVNPLGEKSGSFFLDMMETPDTQFDDLLVYQAQDVSADHDKGYYVMQDTLGCLSIGQVITKIGDPLFMPQIYR